MKPELDEVVTAMAIPFFAERDELDRLFAASCCKRVLVTDTIPEVCGQCKTPIPTDDVLTIDRGDI
jgi:hypothetical protein